ncbi:hypothetical protein [Novosphingobium sp. MBES04]|uniref:hypothetical protein n=1 Tax=Novosphingobium sp. MBES04 TaxID=1206458 RepID=UPI00057F4DB7|nr:hypothetical protein [Novosphingobium sp. MBES04]GAM06351.1 hypothetical protein MBENS4_3348 [Novosphingobium sp. MBES04]
MPTPDSLEAHEELVRLAERRLRRAVEKRDSAQAEWNDAVRAHHEAVEARADWIANCPDEQPLML